MIELALVVSILAGDAGAIHAAPAAVVREEAEGAATWTHVVAHPTDPGRLMICGAVVRPRGSDPASVGFVEVSRDRGASWSRTLTDSGSRISSEQSGAFGRGGRAYFTASREHAKGGLWLYRSDDGGLSWTPTLRGRRFVDLTAMAVDNAEDSPFAGRLYLFGHFLKDPAREPEPSRRGRVPMPLLSSRDGGQSLSDPAAPGREPGRFRAITYPGGAAVTAGGTALAVYRSMHVPPGRDTSAPADLPNSIEVARSVDGGETVEVVRVAEHDDWIAAGALPDLPSIALAPARPGGPPQACYVAWSDLSTGRAEVRLSRSDDSGRTWTRPTRVDDAPGAGPFLVSHPSVAVGADGAVVVTWRDVRRACWRASASFDQGATFLPGEPLSPPNGGPPAGPLDGPYSIARASDVGLAVDAGGAFHTAWAEPLARGSRLVAVRFEVRKPMAGRTPPR